MTEKKDALLWMHNPKNGMVTASLAYDLLVSSMLPLVNTSIMSRIWGFSIPLKIKCFLWLAIDNRISTWDILKSKGWSGPN